MTDAYGLLLDVDQATPFIEAIDIVIHSTQGSRHWESLMLKLNSTRLFVPISCSLPNRMAKWLWTW